MLAERRGSTFRRRRSNHLRLHYCEAQFLFEPRDLWLGVYWKRWPKASWPKAIEFYICFLPCLPLRLYFQWYS